MTDFTYNSIRLGYVHTVNIGQQAIRDPSDTDMLYTKFTIHLRTIVAMGTTNATPPGSIKEKPILALAGGAGLLGLQGAANIDNVLTPAEVMVKIRHMLLTPRRALVLNHGGKTMIAVPAMDGAGNALDDANGPKPQHCSITQITDHTYEIEYVVEVCLTDCDNKDSVLRSNRVQQAAVGPVGSDWLSCRMSMSHDIDEYGYTKIHTVGKLITRSSLLLRGGPDTLRSMVTPTPIPGMIRHSHYQVSEDGLSLSFSFTDTELYMCPPPGCTKANGSYTIATSNYGAMWYCDVDLALEGRKGFDKKSLMELAMSICMDRIRRSTPIRDANTGKMFIIKASFTDEMYGPGVRVHLTTRVGGPVKIGENKDHDTTARQVGTVLGAGVGFFVTGGPVGAIIGGIAGREIGKLFEDDEKKNPAPPPTIIDTFNFGSESPLGGPLGSRLDSPILMTSPERGNYPFLQLIALAFNDPCLQRATSVPEQTSTLRRNGAPVPRPPKVGTLKLVPSNPAISASIKNDTQAAMKSTAKIELVNYIQDITPYVTKEVTDGGIWQLWDCNVSYNRDYGKRAMPPMSSSGTVAFPQVHSDYMVCRIQWVASKVGHAPTIPNHVSPDPNLVLLNMYRGYDGIEMGPGGQDLTYTANGEYTYGVVNVNKVEETWPFPPFLNISRNDIDKPADQILGWVAGVDLTRPRAVNP